MKHRIIFLGVLMVFFLALVGGLAGVLPAHAATFTVNSFTDAHDASPGDGICDTGSGQCSLRAAIEEANALAGSDVISVPAGTYSLSLGLLNVMSDTLISGVLSTTTIVDGGGLDGVFLVSVPSNITPTVTLSHLTIRDGLYGASGGGVDNEGGNLTLSDTRVMSNSTYAGGGGIANSGTMTITTSSIISNTSASGGTHGGGISNSGTLTLIQSVVSGNRTLNPFGNGGGIYNQSSGTLILTGTAVLSNSTSFNGGGIESFGLLSLTNSQVMSNTAQDFGGGIRVAGGEATLVSSTMKHNWAVAGAGIYAIGSLSLTNVTVISNTAQDSAGGISSLSVATITNSSILDNLSGISGTIKSGGGISFGGALNLAGSVVKGNRTTNSGGGIYAANSGSLTITGTTISNNSVVAPSTSGGGGIFDNSIPMTLTNSTVSGNTSNGDGGGIYHYNADLSLVNSTVSGNTAKGYGGGLYFFTISVTPTTHLSNVTITQNKADSDNNLSGEGGGFYSNNESAVSVKNSILAGNLGPSTSPEGSGLFTSLGYNLVGVITGTSGFTATGDITNTAPLLGLLQDNGGPTFTHGFLFRSPAIDTGNPASCTDQNGDPLTTDQRGLPRPMGAQCDIGAYELQGVLSGIFLPLIRR